MAAQVSHSTFYYQPGLRHQDDKYNGLTDTIKTVFERHRGCHGYRRITAVVLQLGYVVNQKWGTDVTEFNVAGEKLYLSPILDLYNGEIIAFETNKRPVFDMVNSMLKTALAKLQPHEKPMLHSNVSCASGYSYKACPATATAMTMRPWKASSGYSSPRSST